MKGILIVASGALLAAAAVAGPAAAEVSDRSNECYYSAEGSSSWLNVDHKRVRAGSKLFEACKGHHHHYYNRDDHDDHGDYGRWNNGDRWEDGGYDGYDGWRD
ncbi:hypothetical protein [Nonomuraea sp. SBT364]|uniref:hypothetical protein n=1 Tax=Nonomuraea sp. SBT364 TaxID=1580530 RepID=UPI00066E7486|nr:hypothetical protein [Nonomuraea sp. SBT364]